MLLEPFADDDLLLLPERRLALLRRAPDHHVQGAPRRDARLSCGVHAQRSPLDAPRGRALRVGDPAFVPGRDGDAAEGYRAQCRLRAGRGLLRRRGWQERHAAELLLRRARADKARYRTALRGRPRAHGAPLRPGARLAARREARLPLRQLRRRHGRVRTTLARLAVLRGGTSMERDVSFVTG